MLRNSATKRITKIAYWSGTAFAVLIGGVAGVLFLQAHRDQPYSRDNPLVIMRNNNVGIEDDIITQISNQRTMVLQRGIGSIPVISSWAIASTIEKWTRIGRVEVAHFAINFPALLSHTAQGYGMFDFGGVILYQTNLENLRTLAEYKEYVSSVRRQLTFTVFVKVVDQRHSTQQIYELEVAPFIFADCDLSYAGSQYCRGSYMSPSLSLTSAANPQDKVRKMIQEFAKVGLSSTLSPDVDLEGRQTVASAVGLAMFASVALHQNGMVPALKHFMYDSRLGNTHNASFYNPITESQFQDGLAPYIAVEKLGIPYFIMLSHHRLPLDPEIPLPLSSRARDFIRSHFSNAITMSDEIKMGGLEEGRTLHEAVKELRTDCFLFHSGNLTFSVSDIITGLEESDPVESTKSVQKLLSLKLKMGLLKMRTADGQPISKSSRLVITDVGSNFWSRHQ